MSRFSRPRGLGPVPEILEAPTLPSAILRDDCVTVMATLPAASADLVLTDPPYGCNYRDRAGRRVANDNRTDRLEPAFAGVPRLMKPDSLCVNFYGWHVVDTFMTAWRAAGLRPVAHRVFPCQRAPTFSRMWASKIPYLACFGFGDQPAPKPAPVPSVVGGRGRPKLRRAIGPAPSALEHVDDARDHPTVVHPPGSRLVLR